MKSKLNEGWVETVSHRKIYFKNPKEEMFNINDIAWGLSNICRYAGQVPTFYSVATHSVYVAEEVRIFWPSQSIVLRALLHDAVEAYTSDIPSPFKELFPEVVQMEKTILNVIYHKFKLQDDAVDDYIVSQADKKVLLAEKRSLLPGSFTWNYPLKPSEQKIVPVSPELSNHKFLSAYHKIRQMELSKPLIEG